MTMEEITKIVDAIPNISEAESWKAIKAIEALIAADRAERDDLLKEVMVQAGEYIPFGLKAKIYLALKGGQ